MRIVATAFAVPDRIEHARDLSPRIGRSEDWICEHAGVMRRHVAEPDADPAVLGAKACNFALAQDGGAAPDLIVNASSTDRQAIPDSSVFIQRELGFTGIPSFTINATCLSFLPALHMADALLARKAYRRILICSVEHASLGRNFEQPEAAALLGDGAAAVVLQCDESPSGLIHYAFQTWPEGAELSELRGGGVMRLPGDPRTRPDDFLFHMDGPAVYRFVMRRMGGFLETFFNQCGKSIDDLALIVPHQASRRAMRLLNHVGFPEQKIINISADYGNCVAASLPMALAIAQREGRIQRNDLVMLLGTSAGISIGAALLRW